MSVIEKARKFFPLYKAYSIDRHLHKVKNGHNITLDSKITQHKHTLIGTDASMA